MGGYTILMPAAIVASRYFAYGGNCYAVIATLYLPSAIIATLYFPTEITTLWLCVFVFKKCFISRRMQGLYPQLLYLCGLIFSLLYKPICRKANYVPLVFKISLQLSIINYQFLYCVPCGFYMILLWFTHPFHYKTF